MSNYESVAPKKGLGRGLGSLLGGVDSQEEPAKPLPVTNSPRAAVAQVIPDEARIWLLGTEKIIPNSRQPRKEFDPEKLKELAASIKEKGILQPIIVRKTTKGFEIIAGERRWRAAQQAGLQEIPVILRKADDADSLELALIENIQRHDLNPIDEAEAYQQLAERFGQTQEQIAQKVGKDRSTVTNSMRLLGLGPQVKDMLRNGTISTGHAKILVAISDPAKQLEIAKKIVNLRLSVRAAETLIKTEALSKQDNAPRLGMDVSKSLVKSLSEELQKILGTKVQIDYSNQKGKISVHFYSDDELTQIVERLRKSWKN